MKHGKKPTREQRKLLDKLHLDARDWFVVKDTPEEMTIIHRHFDAVKKVIHKES